MFVPRIFRVPVVSLMVLVCFHSDGMPEVLSISCVSIASVPYLQCGHSHVQSVTSAALTSGFVNTNLISEATSTLDSGREWNSLFSFL